MDSLHWLQRTLDQAPAAWLFFFGRGGYPPTFQVCCEDKYMKDCGVLSMVIVLKSATERKREIIQRKGYVHVWIKSPAKYTVKKVEQSISPILAQINY